MGNAGLAHDVEFLPVELDLVEGVVDFGLCALFEYGGGGGFVFTDEAGGLPGYECCFGCSACAF